ncbi:MAG: hypothetical protein HF314_05835 [Ignavibacteria bacterium]|jgi:hypothetical protein|nr:hypothetical protein [Ignavibacteria bacterium]MCU7502572.1 hypothetical protein [Ignavibacteria bacterium]MCU7515225.1 hypothetical protein [Ignavibacteria bacterium]
MSNRKDEFEDYVFNEISYAPSRSGNLIKGRQTKISGNVKVSVEEDSHDGVKIILKKDKNENIKEIKFVCTCGQTKTILLDYSE